MHQHLEHQMEQSFTVWILLAEVTKWERRETTEIATMF